MICCFNSKLLDAACFSVFRIAAKQCCGCFFFQGGHKVFEQEFYNQFKYNSPRPYFLTFDTDVSIY